MNTGFAGPQLADVIDAEHITILVHDDDFAALVNGVRRCELIDGTTARAAAGSGASVPPNRHQGRTIILTSGTTGRPKGAARDPDANAVEGVAALLSRVPLRPGDVQVVAGIVRAGANVGRAADGPQRVFPYKKVFSPRRRTRRIPVGATVTA